MTLDEIIEYMLSSVPEEYDMNRPPKVRPKI